ncbi:MAG TPA: sigma 54-interacting transcriptional regulator [Polyangiales bacterium]|jgi:DNA-binding NtrC family response regulator|nr:sigma 54-interacting transcriptional regulator [Polyangiales bacterium]
MREDEQTIEALIRPSRPLSRVSIQVIDGKARGLSVELLPNQPVSIGKSPDNQLHLDDMTVSRYHVELVLRRGEIEVRDLESMNGTYIGEVRVSRVLVRPGTKLTIGANTILLHSQVGDLPSIRPEPEGEVEVPGVIAQSPAMRKVLQSIGRLAGSNVTVLLQGETGTGKEVLARALHDLSDRRDAPFEVVDCGSMAPTLIASELFGHERGAFTGAHGEHAGAFERAHGGTVFLDEIGELPIDLQPMLLGVLERRRFKRVGGVRERSVNVRVVAATHRDLRNATNLGTFRADLYFRLAVARVVIPPLRERPDDIAPLVRRFAEQLTGDPNAQPFDNQTLTALEAHPWSGNVRELRNVVESAVALGSVVLEGETGGELPSVAALEQAAALPETLLSLPYREARAHAVAGFERAYLRRLTAACGGNASEAARRAKMDRPYLLGLLRKHGLR